MMLVWYRSVSGSERAQAQLIFDRTISRFMFVRPAQQRIQKEIVFCHNLQATNIVHLSKSLPSLPSYRSGLCGYVCTLASLARCVISSLSFVFSHLLMGLDLPSLMHI